MKKVAIISTGRAQAKDLAELENSADFRKATLNMKLATLAFRELLSPFSALAEDFKKDLTLFLGTGHGEFNATLEFLKGWAQQRFPRPFLFQSSLHNSTTGFVGLSQGLQAAACTTSHHYFSGEDALDLARQFLLTGNAEVAAVIGVDARAGENLPLLEGAGFPHSGWGQGAGAVMLATTEYCERKKIEILGELGDIEISLLLDQPVYKVKSDFVLAPFYDSHAVEKLAEVVTERGVFPLRLEKPNGGHSLIHGSLHV
jgi:3-oxoacyl-(acyl-carrier-protein) synthase